MTDELPTVFLRYEAPKPAPESHDRPVVSPVFTQQYEQLSAVPVVTTTDKVLDCILPPRTFTSVDTGVPMLQRVEHTQVGRDQLSELRQVFDLKLADAKARTDGVCPVRRTIYAMLFDELLRQVCVDNPERGLLLVRIRDELRMTIDAYGTLYDASVVYSGRKLHEATKSLPEMRNRVSELRGETDVLRKELSRLQAKHAAMVRWVEEQQQADNKKFREENLFLEKTKLRLQDHLAAVKAAQEAERRALREEVEEG